MKTLSTFLQALALVWLSTSLSFGGWILNPYVFPSAPAGPSPVFLAHFHGTAGATTFTDSTGNHTMTAVGNAQLSASQTLYGATSLYLDGSGDYVSMPASADWSFGTTGDFTVEAWMRLDSSDLVGAIMCLSTRIYYLSFTGSTTYGGNTSANDVSYALTGKMDKWTLITHMRKLGIHYLFYDGTLVATSSYTALAYGDASGTMYIGRDPALGESKIYIDSIRVVKGTAIYPTTGFTPAAF